MSPSSGHDRAAYELVGQADSPADTTPPAPMKPVPSRGLGRRTTKAIAIAVAASVIVFIVFMVISNDAVSRLRGSVADAISDCECRSVDGDVPLHFQTSPQVYAGPTATGPAPFMAQTVAFDAEATYVPNEPLQTAVPVEGMKKDGNIFKLMG